MAADYAHLRDPHALLRQLTLEEKVPLLAGADLWRTAAVPRLRVPYAKMTDGPNGARGAGDFNHSVPAALFPSPSCLGATWDVHLARAMGQGIARDSRSKRCHVSLAPTVNMHRDPRAGRNFEGYSASPVLAGELGAAWVIGCQGEGVAATPKHLVGNEAETDRRHSSSTIAEAALREIYLMPFQRIMRQVAREAKARPDDAFGGQPACIMSAYNRLNLINASEHERVLNTILRGEWGWHGLVISDWLALHAHALKTTDLEMPAPSQHRKLEQVRALLASGEVSEADIDARVLALLRLLRSVAPLGFTDTPEEENETSCEDPELAAVIRRIAAEGAVLLRNEAQLLPLDVQRPPRRIALIGSPARDAIQAGGGSANLTPQYKTDALSAMRRALDALPGGVGKATELTWHAALPIHNFPPPPEASQLHGKLEWYNGSETVAETETGQGIDMWWPPRPPGLQPGKWSLKGTFDIRAKTDGEHTIALLSLGDSTVHIARQEPWVHKGQPDFFEFILNPAQTWAGRKLRMKAGETVQVVVEYTPPPLLPEIEAQLCGAVKLSFDEARDEAALIAEAAETAAAADVAVVFVATGQVWESEGFDRPDIDLPCKQAEVVRAVHRRQPKTIVLNITGAPVELPFLDGDEAVPAAVQMWFGGQESGNAIADVLFGLGDAPASGRMPSTWPRKLQDHFSARSPSTFPGTREGADGLVVRYEEGRLMDHASYTAQNIEPLLWFGGGLGGYASFTTSLDAVEGAITRDDGRLVVTVRAKNTSARSGKEIIQLYVCAPEEHRVGTDRPERALAAFACVRLQAGEEQCVQLELEQESVSFWDGGEDGCWRVRPGRFSIELAHSADPRRVIARASTTITEGWTWHGIGHV